MKHVASLATSPNKKWWIVCAMSISLGMTFIDYTAVTIALPKLQQVFNPSPTFLPWIINAYLLTFAIFLSLGGHLGDVYQHHRVFMIGLLIFLLASISCAIAMNLSWLIYSRVVQGVGAAMIVANSSVMIINTFPSEERGKAMGIYMGSSLLFLPFALVIGGIFTQYFSWRLIFWINLPLSIICLLITYYMRERVDSVPHKAKLNWISLILFAAAISSLVFALMESSNLNWAQLVLLLACSLLFFVFFYFQGKNNLTTIDLDIFNNKLFLSAAILIFCLSVSTTLFVFDAVFYQEVLGFQPAMAGILFFPAILSTMISSPIAGRIFDKHGYQRPVFIGLILIIAGLLFNSALAYYQNYWFLLPGILFINTGLPFVLSPINTAALVSVSPQKRGIISGLLNSIRQIANSVGLALLTSIILLSNRHFLKIFCDDNQSIYPKLSVQDLENLLNNRQITTMTLTQTEIKPLWKAAKDSYTSAYSIGMLSVAFLVSLALIGVLILLKKR